MRIDEIIIIYEKLVDTYRRIKNPPKVIIMEKNGSIIKNSFKVPFIIEFLINTSPIDKKIKLNKIAIEGQKFKDALVKAIDEDTNAFDQVIKAMRMPKDTDNDKEKRKGAMETGYKIATKIPLNTVKECRNALKICSEISKLMDDEMASDVGSGALMAKAGAEAAAYNVKINLRHINDKTFLDNTTKELSELLKECQIIADKVQQRVEKSLKAI